MNETIICIHFIQSVEISLSSRLYVYMCLCDGSYVYVVYGLLPVKRYIQINKSYKLDMKHVEIGIERLREKGYSFILLHRCFIGIALNV